MPSSLFSALHRERADKERLNFLLGVVLFDPAF